MDDGINCSQETFTKKQNKKMLYHKIMKIAKKAIESWV